MGFLGLFKKKEKAEPVPAAPPVMHKVTLNLPSYFKAGDGEYHVFVDGSENVCKPFSRLVLDLAEGVHSFRVFSTPETLADVTEELEIVADVTVSVTVNVKDRTLHININDKLRSHMEFRENFKKENHIKNQ